MTIELAYCTWGLSGTETHALDRIAAERIAWIDIRPGDFARHAVRHHMQELGLRMSCMGLSFGVPPEAALDSVDRAARLAGVRTAESAILRADRLGIPTAYVVPGKDASEEGLACYAESLTRLADHAADFGIRLCIEHFPGTALPSIAATLAFLRQAGHANLYLLLDTGHAQMSGEDLPAAIADAGPLLGYVHLDDNDGRDDLHLALYDGVLDGAGSAPNLRRAAPGGLRRPRLPGAAPRPAQPARRPAPQPSRRPRRAEVARLPDRADSWNAMKL